MPPSANDHPDQPRQPAPPPARAGEGAAPAEPPAVAEGGPRSAQPPAERSPAAAEGPVPAERTPAPPPDATPRASDAERNQAVDRLRAAYVEGRLDQEEFDERSEAALRAKTIGQLDRLFDDLPGSYLPGGLARRYGVAAPVVRPGEGGVRVSVAVMSSIERRGSWRLPEQSTAFAFMGGVELDLRTAILSRQVSTITAVAFMGGIEIIVPPGVRVESSGFGFMGGWDNRVVDDRVDPEAPVVHVRGVAFMGGVDIRTKEPRDPHARRPIEGSA